MARFLHELVLVSASLANLGDDIRHLQASEIAEVLTPSSSSSTMAHKMGNPILAENMDGMSAHVRGEYGKVMDTLGSTLQRDLRGSNVMPGFGAVMVYAYQQLLTAERVLTRIVIQQERCLQNFQHAAKLVVAELLHLYLQREGVARTHEFVNKRIVPLAQASSNDLATEMDRYVKRSRRKDLREAWAKVSHPIRHQLQHPETYLGDAVAMAKEEAQRALD